MRFARPELLWLLLALPLLGAAGWAAFRRRRRALLRFAGSTEHAARLGAGVSRHRRAVKQILLYLGLASLVLAAARPQWGSRLEPIQRRGADVVIVLDNSLSMAAQDIAPDRLGQARHEIDALLENLAGDRVALVTFAGQATLACPLTLDHAAVRLFLETIEVEVTQVPGTALADALRLAVDTFGGEEPDGLRSRSIVLLTDGEDHEGGIDKVFPLLRDAGVTVHAVGCGTERGAPIPVQDESGNSAGYKKDNQERVVTTRLEETLLEHLALETGGRYYRATPGETEVEELANALAEMDTQEFGSVLRARYEERFQIPLGLALVALIAEALLGDRRRAAAGEPTGGPS